MRELWFDDEIEQCSLDLGTGHGEAWITNPGGCPDSFRPYTEVLDELLAEKLFPYYVVTINTGQIYLK